MRVWTACTSLDRVETHVNRVIDRRPQISRFPAHRVKITGRVHKTTTCDNAMIESDQRRLADASLLGARSDRIA